MCLGRPGTEKLLGASISDLVARCAIVESMSVGLNLRTSLYLFRTLKEQIKILIHLLTLSFKENESSNEERGKSFLTGHLRRKYFHYQVYLFEQCFRSMGMG